MGKQDGHLNNQVGCIRVNEVLSHPAVQGGVAPFIASLIVVLLLQSFRLGGLAVVAAFATTVYFVAGFTFTPLTATRKIIMLGLMAPLIGLLVDFAFRPTRIVASVLAVAGAVAALWVFWPVVAQKGAAEAWLLGGTALVTVAVMIGYGQMFLACHAVRAGSAVLGVGLAVGIASIFSASAIYGLYGISLGAGAGGLLLVQMIRGKTIAAGTTFLLPGMLIAGLVGAGAMVLANLPWYALLVIALVPIGAHLPVSQKAPVWLQAVLLSLYCFVIGGFACVLAWLN